LTAAVSCIVIGRKIWPQIKDELLGVHFRGKVKDKATNEKAVPATKESEIRWNAGRVLMGACSATRSFRLVALDITSNETVRKRAPYYNSLF
jgi:hypothetical protein